jgi:hypothetical protein
MTKLVEAFRSFANATTKEPESATQHSASHLLLFSCVFKDCCDYKEKTGISEVGFRWQPCSVVCVTYHVVLEFNFATVRYRRALRDGQNGCSHTQAYQNPRPVAVFGEPIVWVDTARYLRVTLDKRLTWSTHIEQVRKKASQRLGVLGPLPNRRSGLSIRNGVLLFRQLIRPMMDYACPVWWSTARCHIRKLQMLQSRCLHIATGARWYISNG